MREDVLIAIELLLGLLVFLWLHHAWRLDTHLISFSTLIGAAIFVLVRKTYLK